MYAQPEALIDDVCHRAQLTRAEREVVVAFVLTNDRAALRGRLGIAETSVRSRVRGACRKLGIAHLHDVYRILFERVLHGALPQPHNMWSQST